MLRVSGTCCALIDYKIHEVSLSFTFNFNLKSIFFIHSPRQGLIHRNDWIELRKFGTGIHAQAPRKYSQAKAEWMVAAGFQLKFTTPFNGENCVTDVCLEVILITTICQAWDKHVLMFIIISIIQDSHSCNFNFSCLNLDGMVPF